MTMPFGQEPGCGASTFGLRLRQYFKYSTVVFRIDANLGHKSYCGVIGRL